MFDENKVRDIIGEFTVSADELKEIAAAFRHDLKRGLNNPDDSSLRMLKSYVGLPTGKEKGEYIALDFGGTNVRVLKIRLEGAGKFTEIKKVAKPLIVDGVYDYIGADSSAEEMFDFLAGLIDEVLDGDRETKFLLGHTFSFPSEQTDLNNAKLIIWTKEFATPGVEGKVVNDLLKDALLRAGVTNVEPVAVINDTVAVLLSAAYKNPDTYIGSIYATGHNTCYLEPYAETGDVPMILNLESGGYMKLAPNRFDVKYDEMSEKPGEQRLEKMVSGRYMGELFGLALNDILNTDKKYSFTSVDMSNIILDESDELTEASQIIERGTGEKLSVDELKAIKDLAAAIVVRSARLVTASFVGIIWQLEGKIPAKFMHIAVDGSVYEKMPLVKENINRALSEILGENAANVDTVLDNGGSGLGAAIAAAMSKA